MKVTSPARGKQSAATARDKLNRKEKWMVQYHKLIEYKKARGTFDVPLRYKPDPAFGRWVKKQREYYQAHLRQHAPITQERIDLLDDIGFNWKSGGKRTVVADFDTHLQQLAEYQRIQGNFRVPHVYKPNPGLGIFVHRLKQYYREIRKAGAVQRTHF